MNGTPDLLEHIFSSYSRFAGSLSSIIKSSFFPAGDSDIHCIRIKKYSGSDLEGPGLFHTFNFTIERTELVPLHSCRQSGRVEATEYRNTIIIHIEHERVKKTLLLGFLPALTSRGTLFLGDSARNEYAANSG